MFHNIISLPKLFCKASIWKNPDSPFGGRGFSCSNSLFGPHFHDPRFPDGYHRVRTELREGIGICLSLPGRKVDVMKDPLIVAVVQTHFPLPAVQIFHADDRLVEPDPEDQFVRDAGGDDVWHVDDDDAFDGVALGAPRLHQKLVAVRRDVEFARWHAHAFHLPDFGQFGGRDLHRLFRISAHVLRERSVLDVVVEGSDGFLFGIGSRGRFGRGDGGRLGRGGGGGGGRLATSEGHQKTGQQQKTGVTFHFFILPSYER